MFDPRERRGLGKFFYSAIKLFVAIALVFAFGHLVIAHLERTTGTFLAQNTTTDLRVTAVEEALVRTEGVRVLGHIEREKGTSAKAPPVVGAHSYIVADIDSGRVFAEKNADNIRPIASLTKLITALVADDNTNPTLTVQENATTVGGNSADLLAGEMLPLSDLLSPLLLESANDAAATIASHYGETAFQKMMNEGARSAGMTNSRFVEPSGLSQRNVSTARDILRLATHIRREKPSLFEITRQNRREVQTLTATGAERSFVSRNILELRTIEGFAGGKSGFTSAAGKTLLTLFDLRSPSGETHTVAIIVLGSHNSTRDTLSLLSWFRNFSGE